jgi:hypothetical protein
LSDIEISSSFVYALAAMSAGSCVASRSRSRLLNSAAATWLTSDSRRSSSRSRYVFIFFLSIDSPFFKPLDF